MAQYNFNDLSGSDVAKVAAIVAGVAVGIVTVVKLTGSAACAGWAKFQIRRAEKKAKKAAAKAAAAQQQEKEKDQPAPQPETAK